MIKFSGILIGLLVFHLYTSNLTGKPLHLPAVIFCFHDINGKGRYSITQKELIQIFDLFKNKYQVLSLENWYENNMKNKPPGKPTVVLTFDDGFPSLHRDVIPLLEKYQYAATFFIYLDRYAANSVFYKRLAALPSQFDLGSHSFTHDKLSPGSKNIFKELYLSKKKLEYLTNKKVISWAWPYGYYTKELLEQAYNAGYILQVSTDYSLVTPNENYNNMARYTVQRPRPVKRVKAILKHYNEYLKQNTKHRLKK